MTDGGGEANRLIDVELDESIGRSTPDVEHERAVAIFDLIEENSFSSRFCSTCTRSRSAPGSNPGVISTTDTLLPSVA